jgi:SAM-dependent methyltransferase
MIGAMKASSLRARLPLRARADATELLDSGRLAPVDVERNLADLARFNRLPGGSAASVAAVRQLAGSRPGLRLLDVGAGRGDVPLAFARHGWQTVAIDTNPQVLHAARRATRGEELVELLEADGRALPFPDDAFDVAHSSLLVHHLAPEEAVVALGEMRRVARHGVVVNDLRRGLLPLAITGATVLALSRSHVTRNDGIVSARRAYTLDELDDLLDAAGLVRRWRSSSWLPRVAVAAVSA